MVDYTIHQNDLPAGLAFGGQIAIDCEMMGLNLNRDRLCIVQLYDPQNRKIHIVRFDKDCYDAPHLCALLSDHSKLFLGHMIRLDLGWIAKYLNVQIENVYCTRTASRLAQTFGASHDYKDLVSNLLLEKIDKSETASYWGAETLTPEQIKYVCHDVLYLPALKEKLDAMLEREGRSALMRQAMDMLPSRVALDVAGWWGDDILSFPFDRKG